MHIQNSYMSGLMERVIKRNPAEPEFHQAVWEVLQSLTPVVNAHPKYVKEGILESLVEPERIIKFRVPWEDDKVKYISTAVFAFSLAARLDPTRVDCDFILLFMRELSNFLHLSRYSKTA